MDNYDIGTRAVRLAEYITETGATVRAAAAVFGVSKSTVHKDVSVRLKRQDPSLYREMSAVLEKNLLERHIRGGKATKLKYLAEKELTKSGN